MRIIHSMMLRRRAAAVCLLVLSVGLLGCPEHSDFPTQLELVVPPTPTNFVITYTGPNPQGGYDYDLNWTISDATDVDHYRVYLLELGTAPEFVAETINTSLPATLPFLITGLQMGVAAVSTGNVEGHYTSAVAP
jgi:hypothetical protein